MVRLIHIDIPAAASKCLQLAARIKVDLNRIPRGPQYDTHWQVMNGHRNHYLSIARDISNLKYLNESSVKQLVNQNSFLQEFVR